MSSGSFITNGLEMTSLFGEGEAEMDKLLAMLPETGASADAAASVSEDAWMSTWLKDEPVVPGVF